LFEDTYLVIFTKASIKSEKIIYNDLHFSGGKDLFKFDLCGESNCVKEKPQIVASALTDHTQLETTREKIGTF
jgi:hypothetical protein